MDTRKARVRFVTSVTKETPASRPIIGMMDHKIRGDAQTDCSKKIKSVGQQVIGMSGLTMLLAFLVFEQVGHEPMGEIGHFVHDATFFVIPPAIWGLASGIGLIRAWRWARISMLLFGALLALLCAFPAVPFMIAPGRGIGWWEAVGLRVIGLLFLIPPALVLRSFLYFMRDDVKTYFESTRQPPIASR